MPSARHPLAIVLIASTLCLVVGFSRTPFWDEDEPRFAAIARTMLETGDWVVPMYNGELAVDKPVLMHWCMAIGSALFGNHEFAARLPAAVATLLTALALLRAGTRWFDSTTGVVAALAFVGCLLVGIEAHAATPDAILVALTTWATILAVEPLLPGGERGGSAAALPGLGLGRASLIGGLLGLGVLCKGPIGFIGPLAVILPCVGLVALQRRLATIEVTQPPLVRWFRAALPAAIDTLQSQRIGIVTLAMLAVAAPWYLTVAIRTAGAWPAGFFFIHNVGRFVAPMEKHSGSVLYHPLTMLVGFYPWSCFLPLAVVVAAWRVWKRNGSPALTNTLLVLLVWMAVWIGGFSAAATKLPNYILPAYPAAALLVAALGVEAAKRAAWPHPRWLASGLGWVAFGGLATAITVLIGTRFGLAGAEPAAIVGLVPITGAAVAMWYARRSHAAALTALVVTGLVYTGLAVGPGGGRIAAANRLPALIDAAHAHAGGTARVGTLGFLTPNVVYYSRGLVRNWDAPQAEEIADFLRSGPDAVLLVSEDRLAELEAALPEDIGVVARERPLFRRNDFVILGVTSDDHPRTATQGRTRR